MRSVATALLLRRQQTLLLERLRAAAAAASAHQYQHQQQRASVATSAASAAAESSSPPQNKYLAPSVARDPRFARLRDDDLAFFREVLGDAGVVTGEDALEPYNRSG